MVTALLCKARKKDTKENRVQKVEVKGNGQEV
jgi:hypothetical protein